MWLENFALNWQALGPHKVSYVALNAGKGASKINLIGHSFGNNKEEGRLISLGDKQLVKFKLYTNCSM